MLRPPRRPALWEVVLTVVMGAAFLAYGILTLVLSSPEHLAYVSPSYRSRGLSTQGWSIVGVVVGAAFVLAAGWAGYWRRYWPHPGPGAG